MNHNQKEKLVSQIIKDLAQFHTSVIPLPGIQPPGAAEALARQIVDSIQRVEYVYTVSSRPVTNLCSIPQSGAFDPIKAAVWHKNNGSVDEACWLTFLAINFGKHKTLGWRLTEEIYGGLTAKPELTWAKVMGNSTSVSTWLNQNKSALTGKFGNHRKYESLDTAKQKHTGETIRSYIDLITQNGGHQAYFTGAIQAQNGDPRKAFSAMYSEFNSVIRFGRTAKFDYLTMLSKLGLCGIEPDKAYLSEATGPKDGIRLLIDGKKKSGMANGTAEAHIARLGAALPVNRMVMQVMEDAICNWQKSPKKFVRFRG